MSSPLPPTELGCPDDWSFWELVYSDPELVAWDLPPNPIAVDEPAPDSAEVRLDADSEMRGALGTEQSTQ